jgi:2-polyprenyl-3-methyl-5-hydroxy-6-metoxy-1,4-benzoquinol methylase
MSGSKEHWEKVYSERQADEVSWFQEQPLKSLELIGKAGLTPEACIIDVGAGASVLSDRLLAEGHTCVAALDIAEASLAQSKERLGLEAAKVEWLTADATAFEPPRTYDLWHDRAVFHFMTEAGQREGYLRSLKRGLKAGGWLVLAAFALDGPEKCSGLPVVRYDAKSLGQALGAEYSLKEQAAETHKTPWDTEQRFNYYLFQRAA